MDRRYLAATIVIVATFSLVNHAVRAGQLPAARDCAIRAVLEGRYGSPSEIAQRLVAKVRDRFMPGYPEEPRMLAEMNVPLMRAQARIAQQAARRQAEAAKCAQEKAQRALEQAQRDMEKNSRIQDQSFVRVTPAVAKRVNVMVAGVRVPAEVMNVHAELAPLVVQTHLESLAPQMEIYSDQIEALTESAMESADSAVAQSEAGLAPAAGSHQQCESTHQALLKAQVTREQVRRSVHAAVQNAVRATKSFTSDYHYYYYY